MSRSGERSAGGEPDQWLDWLLRGRDAGDPEVRSRSHAFLRPLYERVLDQAELRDGETVLEVGAGEGTLGFLALERVGPAGRLVLSDVSASVVDHLRARVPPSLVDRVSVVPSPVEALDAVDDASVDVVLSRSVLIYARDLAAAFTSMSRVLRPGGRLSLFEPLWRFHEPPDAAGEFFGRDLAPVAEEVSAVRAVYAASSAGWADVSAAALGAGAEAAGFARIRILVEAESVPLTPGDDAQVRQALSGRPNPGAPSATEAARAALAPERAEVFLAALEAAVRTGRGRTRRAGAFLTAATAEPRPGG
jgi:ubiquinone/menaquinone biosynthesis C-methylase UbiE